MSAVLQAARTVVRPMTRADLREVDRIERCSYPYPWSPGIFRDCLAAGYCCRIVGAAGRVFGYAVMSVAAGEAHILNVCIDPVLRRCGHARRLLCDLIGEARRGGATRLFLEVRPSNEAARGLYEAAGFEQVGVRRGYYPDAGGREDALILARTLTENDLP